MNRDWRKLKHSANEIPTNDSLLPYVLEVLHHNHRNRADKVLR